MYIGSMLYHVIPLTLLLLPAPCLSMGPPASVLEVMAPEINLTLVENAGGNVTFFPPSPFLGVQGRHAYVIVVMPTRYHDNMTYSVSVDNYNVAVPSVSGVTSLTSAIKGQTSDGPEVKSSSGPSYVIDGRDDVSMDLAAYTVVNVSIRLRRLGRARMFINKGSEPEPPSDRDDDVITYDITVIRKPDIAAAIFHYGIMLMMVVINFCFGCDLDLGIVWGFVKKPIPPAIGFTSQFLLMPLIGLTVTQILRLDPIYGFGLIALSCAPGGGGSNAFTILLGGDLNLSITMTFLSTVLSLGMMPLWLLIVARIYFDPSDLTVPYLQIFLTLLQFTIPCLFGVLFRKLREKWAINVAKITKPLCLLFLLWVLTIGTYVNWYMWELMGEVPKIIAAGILLPWVGFAGGFGLATLARQGRKRAVTIAIETGIQNVGIPILMLQMKFPQPDGDMAASVANSVALFTPIPLYIALIVLVVRKKCNKKDDMQPVPTEDAKVGDNEKATMETADNNKNDVKDKNGVV